MKLPPLKKTRMLTPSPGERLTDRPVVVLLLFLAMLLVMQIGQILLAVIGLLVIPNNTSAVVQTLIQLFVTVASVTVVILWCRLGERRSLTTLGFVKKDAPAEYVLGLVGGFVLFGGAVVLCVLTGTATVSVASEVPSVGLILLFFVGFLIQGMSEELMCRAYLMVSLSRKWPLWACAVSNALLFSLLHLGNDGVSVLALVNIFLFGLFASLLTLRRGSIWMVGALHSMWNFVQGNVFGIPVSGVTGIPAPLSTSLSTGTWQELVNGGAFGLEGGLGVTAVLVIGLVVMAVIPTKKSEVVEAADVSHI